MRNVLTVLLIAFTFTAAAQQRRIVRAGGPEELKGWPQPEIRTGLTPEQKAAAAGAYAAKLVADDRFSGALLVAKDGRTLYSNAWGLADRAANKPNTIDTKFNIGSINKIFTKTAIAQLAAAGKLSLDDTVRKHLPDYPSPVADRITIRQLINHRSGLGDFFGGRYDAAPPARLRELSDFLKLFAEEPLQFEPGTSQRYSNAGYIVLGLIVEHISGEKYRDYVQKHIFAPAGMTNSGFFAVDENVPNRATGYTMRGPDGPLPQRQPNTKSLPGRPSSAGGAYASAADLVRFFDALATRKLLDAKWTNWMLSDSFDTPPSAPAIGVAGGAPGVNAVAELGNGWTVIAMSNYDPPSAEALARGAMQIIREKAGAEDDDEGPVIRRGPPRAPQKSELSAPAEVPLGSFEHLVTISAKINGKGPYQLVIDSGAAGLMRVTPELAKALSLEQVGETLAGDPSGKNATKRPIVHVDSVDIGAAHFEGIEAVVSSGRPETDGVLGLSMFAGLTATIDYPKQRFRLSREPLAADGAHVVAFTTPRGIPVIDIEIGGSKVAADVDTGSPSFLTIPAGWTSRFAFAEEPRVVGKGRTTSNEFEIKSAKLKEEVRVAGWNETEAQTDIVEIFPGAHVGSRLLRRYAITFDMANSRLALGR